MIVPSSPNHERGTPIGHQDAPNICQGRHRVWHEHDAKAADDAIKTGISEWQALHIGSRQVQQGSFIPRFQGGQHALSQIRCNHHPIGARQSRFGKCRFPHARSKIQHMVARL